ncbi:hypothetical protein [Variibacter gotjawalensis]|uniref:hypothetical protein n=1 Tax=Variibacter gotjawalensis TaxID=1333996 RepID=UPI00102B2453|nr:hypothetical protein [Variibacter gotjawalensis]NIK45853.1 hypothetical protein [Variibacter gotjawalensis]
MNSSVPAKSQVENLALSGEAILAVERTFAIRFSDIELQSFSTVGQMFDVVRAKVFATGAHATSIAYQRVRNVLSGYAAANEIVADARLSDLIEMPAYKFHALLERQTGLNVPGFHFSRMGNVGLALILAGAILMIAPLIIAMPKWLGFVSFIAGVGLMYADERQLPDATLGDFSRELAALNAASLARPSPADETALRDALVRVLKAETGTHGTITPATRLL